MNRQEYNSFLETMWKYAVLFSVLLAYSEGVTTSGPDIVDGVIAGKTDRPYQVSLQLIFNVHVCGGSILNEYWVLTAGHCTAQYNDSTIGYLYAAVGMLNVNEPGQSRPVDRKLEHEKYDPADSYNNDIALVKVKQPFTYNDMVKPVPLPKPHEPVPDGSPVVVSGWGYLGGEENISPTFLHEVTIYVVGLEKCKKLVEPGTGQKVHKTNVCAYNSKKRAGECTNDSGGPLTLNGTQVGIVSWSFKDPYCASDKRPAQYTRVASYIDWIKKHTTN